MIHVSSVYRVSISCIKKMAYVYTDLECADQDSPTSSMELGHEDLSSSGEMGSRSSEEYSDESSDEDEEQAYSNSRILSHRQGSIHSHRCRSVRGHGFRRRGIRGRGRGRYTSSRMGSRPIKVATRPTVKNELDGPWEKKESNALMFPFTGGDPGPCIPIDSSMSASDLFGRLFTEKVWELITVETNRYVSKQRQQCLHDSPRAWHDVLWNMHNVSG